MVILLFQINLLNPASYFDRKLDARRRDYRKSIFKLKLCCDKRKQIKNGIFKNVKVKTYFLTIT